MVIIYAYIICTPFLESIADRRSWTFFGRSLPPLPKNIHIEQSSSPASPDKLESNEFDCVLNPGHYGRWMPMINRTLTHDNQACRELNFSGLAGNFLYLYFSGESSKFLDSSTVGMFRMRQSFIPLLIFFTGRF